MPNQTQYPPFWDGLQFFDYAGLTAEQWSTLLAENCIPSAVFGPIHHTLFLGLSIVSFTASVGWNDQVGSITVQLVEDTCPGIKIYWDEDLQIRLHTEADPGFVGASVDIIGSPVYFRVDNFEFAGLVQSVELSSSPDAKAIYTVQVVDPRQILQGSQFIVGEYAGGIGGTGFDVGTGPYNLFNVYGYMESTVGTCSETYLDNLDVDELPSTSKYIAGSVLPDGAMFGSEAGGFGGAKVNENGMPWSTIHIGANALMNQIPRITNNWSPYGRLMFKATNSSLGCGLVKGDVLCSLGAFTSLPIQSDRWLAEYFLDLSELPTPPATWRIGGSSISVMEAISQLCEDAGYDYYIELILVRGVSTLYAPSGIAKFIKIRTVRRLLQPTTGEITAFIGGSEATSSTSIGTELRNEPTTSFLIGGNKNTYYQIESEDYVGDNDAEGAYDDDTIVPYFGVDANNDVIIPTKKQDDDDTWRWYFTVDGTQLENSLQLIDINATLGTRNIQIGELELLSAKAGYDSWQFFVTEMMTDTGKLLDSVDIGGLWTLNALLRVGNGFLKADDLIGRDMVNQNHNKLPGGPIGDPAAKKAPEDANTVFNWVNNFATEYYGKKFQVRVPYTCVRQDVESGEILTSESPTQVGWTDQPYILGLANGSILHAFLTDETGRTETMVRFDNANTLDVTNLNADDFGYVADTNRYYIRCSVDGEYVYRDKSERLDPRGVIALPQMVQIKDDNDEMKFVGLLFKIIELKVPADQQVATKDAANEALKKIGNKMAYMPIEHPMVMPSGAGFGVQSNVLTYGPWVTRGPAGTVRVDHDSGLVPWEYGSITAMNVAGQAKADLGITYMQVCERGHITIPGYPTIPLGAELGAINAGFYGAGQNLIENRVALLHPSQYAVVNMGGWVGQHGPNVTDISVSVGVDGLQSTYNMRTYTPKYGRFSRSNAESLKKVGQARLKLNKEIKLRGLKSNTLSNTAIRKKLLGIALEKERMGEQAGQLNKDQGSPHELLIGSIINPFNTDYERTVISTLEMKEITTQVDDFLHKAVMGFEGLIRPVSMDGGNAGLPQYAAYIAGCNLNTSVGAQSPILYSTDGGDTILETCYNSGVHQDFLNPLSNPASLNRSDVSVRAASTYVGHDMDLLAQGSLPNSFPTGVDGTGINMQIVGYTDSNKSNYADDYRFFALRGPLLLQSWGYDLDGRPVPNGADTILGASGGSFASTNLSEKFLSDWLRKPHTWPVAPVDLRYDRKRGVWTAPPPYRLLYATLTKGCLSAGGTVKAQINTTKTGTVIQDNAGNDISDYSYITLTEKNGSCYPSGSSVTTYYDPVTCQNIVLEGQSLNLLNQACGTGNPTALGVVGELVFGTGLIGISDDVCCRKVLMSNITIQGEDASGNSVGPTRFESLILGNGLAVSGTGCTYTLTASSGGLMTVVDLTPIECATGTEPSGTYSTLSVGNGLVAHEIANKNVQISLSFNISNDGGLPSVSGISSLSLSSCLQATGNGCDATIGFASGITPASGAGRIWYVADIECSGGSLVITKNYFDYSTCGTITATGSE